MSQSFNVGDDACSALRDLWVMFGVKSNADALGRAISLSKACAPYVGTDGTLVVSRGDKELIIQVGKQDA